MLLEQSLLMSVIIFLLNRFEKAIVQFNAFYLYGLTATPRRKNNDQKLIFVYIGNIFYQLNQQEYLSGTNIQTEINIKETGTFRSIRL